MAATMVTATGKFGQVEANQLQAMVNGNILAQLPVDSTVASLAEIENGRFLCYDYANGKIVLPSAAPDLQPYLVYSEKKIYDERLGYSDYVMKTSDYIDGAAYPRLFGPTVGDIYTTNTVAETFAAVNVDDTLFVNDDGFLSKTAPATSTNTLKYKVVKKYTLPDGAPAIKVQCIFVA